MKAVSSVIRCTASLGCDIGVSENTDMENSLPLVSVVVLTYNQAVYIGRAMDGILSQKTDFPFEILVGDDASTDGTGEILQEYAKKYPGRIRLFLREENLGASRNIYELLCAARGTYIATCEGDDYWISPHKLQKQKEALEENPACVGCVHPFQIVDEKGEPFSRKTLSWIREKERFSFQDFQGLYLPGQFSTWFFRNIFADSGGRYASVYTIHRQISDRVIMMTLLLQGDILRLPERMSCYRYVVRETGRNATSQFYRKNEGMIRQEMDITEKLESYAQEVFRRNVRFQKRRYEIFTDAFVQWIKRRDPQSREDRRAALAFTGKKIRAVFRLPVHLLIKCKEKWAVERK